MNNTYLSNVKSKGYGINRKATPALSSMEIIYVAFPKGSLCEDTIVGAVLANQQGGGEG